MRDTRAVAALAERWCEQHGIDYPLADDIIQEAHLATAEGQDRMGIVRAMDRYRKREYAQGTAVADIDDGADRQCPDCGSHDGTFSLGWGECYDCGCRKEVPRVPGSGRIPDRLDVAAARIDCRCPWCGAAHSNWDTAEAMNCDCGFSY